MCLQFGFGFFWQNNFGTIAAHKMLVKLTPGGSLKNISSPQKKIQNKPVLVALNLIRAH